MSKITNDWLKPVWHRMLYSCTNMATFKGFRHTYSERTELSSTLEVHHVLHRLLPAKSTQPYNLRRRRHSFSLTQKQSSYDDCNFISRMLFYHIYWLNYFLALPRISLFHCAACHTWLLNEYMYMTMCYYKSTCLLTYLLWKTEFQNKSFQYFS